MISGSECCASLLLGTNSQTLCPPKAPSPLTGLQAKAMPLVLVKQRSSRLNALCDSIPFISSRKGPVQVSRWQHCSSMLYVTWLDGASHAFLRSPTMSC